MTVAEIITALSRLPADTIVDHFDMQVAGQTREIAHWGTERRFEQTSKTFTFSGTLRIDYPRTPGIVYIDDPQ